MSQLHLLSPKGFRAAGVAAGIKKSGKPDVALLVADHDISAAAVFTTNQVVAAPVVVGRLHIQRGNLRAIVVNSGNANACTGKIGLRDARAMASLTASLLGCEITRVLPSSTGVIGHLLPMDKLSKGIKAAHANLGHSAEHALAFQNAISTTDAFLKQAAMTLKIGKETVTIAGVCKGAGMIGPRMKIADKQTSKQTGKQSSKQTGKHATMLAYVTTDALVGGAALRAMLTSAAEQSFNVSSVDDHTSTNDTLAVLASGASGVTIASDAFKKKFSAALNEVCLALAKQVVSDGEGATKVVVIRVTGAASDRDAQQIARQIGNSNLVKCAMHGNDPNWGRIVSAAGLGSARFVPEKSKLTLCGTVLYRGGSPVAFDAVKVSSDLKQKEVVVDLSCGLGKGQAVFYTCDLSKMYVTINADYTT